MRRFRRNNKTGSENQSWLHLVYPKNLKQVLFQRILDTKFTRPWGTKVSPLHQLLFCLWVTEMNPNFVHSSITAWEVWIFCKTFYPCTLRHNILINFVMDTMDELIWNVSASDICLIPISSSNKIIGVNCTYIRGEGQRNSSSWWIFIFNRKFTSLKA